MATSVLVLDEQTILQLEEIYKNSIHQVPPHAQLQQVKRNQKLKPMNFQKDFQTGTSLVVMKLEQEVILVH